MPGLFVAVQLLYDIRLICWPRILASAVQRKASREILRAKEAVRMTDVRAGNQLRNTTFAYASHSSSSAEDLVPPVPQPPNVKLTATNDYRESYSNSVQVRVSVWDFFLAFGTLRAQTPNEVEVANFQGIYLSPQQAKALLMILQQNVSQYESAFGEIKLDPQFAQQGPVN